MSKSDVERDIKFIINRSKNALARNDVNGLCVSKLAEIVYDNRGPLDDIAHEIASDPERAYQTMLALLGIIVQYSFGTTSLHFIQLCEYLTKQTKDERDALPGISDAKW